MSCPMCEKKGVPGASALTEEEKKNGVRIAVSYTHLRAHETD